MTIMKQELLPIRVLKEPVQLLLPGQEQELVLEQVQELELELEQVQELELELELVQVLNRN